MHAGPVASTSAPSAGRTGRKKPKRPPVPHSVEVALRSNTGMRLLSGFLMMFMAFLLREISAVPGLQEISPRRRRAP